MQVEDDIRLKRLEATEAIWRFSKGGWDQLIREIGSDESAAMPVLTSLNQVGMIQDVLSWVLGESKGQTMNDAIAVIENLSRYFKTGQFRKRFTSDQAIPRIKEALTTGSEICQKLIEDKKRLLGIDWPGLESSGRKED